MPSHAGPIAMDENAYRETVFLSWVADGSIRLDDVPEWARHQAMQFDFLLRRGLSPAARVLDMGCGPLRLGSRSSPTSRRAGTSARTSTPAPWPSAGRCSNASASPPTAARSSAATTSASTASTTTASTSPSPIRSSAISARSRSAAAWSRWPGSSGPEACTTPPSSPSRRGTTGGSPSRATSGGGSSPRTPTAIPSTTAWR